MIRVQKELILFQLSLGTSTWLVKSQLAILRIKLADAVLIPIALQASENEKLLAQNLDNLLVKEDWVVLFRALNDAQLVA